MDEKELKKLTLGLESKLEDVIDFTEEEKTAQEESQRSEQLQVLGSSLYRLFTDQVQAKAVIEQRMLESLRM